MDLFADFLSIHSDGGMCAISCVFAKAPALSAENAAAWCIAALF